MNSKQMMKEAQKVCNRDGTACIYADYSFGKGSEVVIGGGLIYIVQLLSNVATRVAEKSGTSFEEVIKTMKLLKTGRKAETVQDGEIRGVSDPETLIRQEVEEDIERRYKQRLRANDDLIQRQALEITASAAQVRRMSEKVEAVRKAGREDMEQAQREIRKKESEIRKLRAELEEYQREA